MPSRLTTPAAFVVAGSLLIAWSGIFVRLADLPPATSAFLRCAYAVPLLAGLAWWRVRGGVEPLGTRQRRWALAAGVFFGADLLLWHVSIGAVGAGLATVLGNTQVVLFPLAAWIVWREAPGSRQLLALPVLGVGIVLISGAIGADSYGEDPLLGAVTGLLTGVAYAGFLLCMRAGSGDMEGSPAATLSIATAVAAVICAAGGLVAGSFDPTPTWPEHGWMLLLAWLCQVLAWLWISGSLNRVRAARLSILLLVQPVAALLLGVVVLAEDPSITQWLGSVLVLSGVFIGGTRAARNGDMPEPVEPPVN